MTAALPPHPDDDDGIDWGQVALWAIVLSPVVFAVIQFLREAR